MSARHSHRAADPEYLKAIRREAPERSLTRDISRIPRSRVEDMQRIVRNSGVAEQIDKWYWADNPRNYRGGAPRKISTETLWTLWMLMATDNKSMLVTDMAELVAGRLSNNSMRLLGLWDKKRKEKGWEHVLRHAKNRAFSTVDSFPGNRQKFPTLAEMRELLADYDPTAPNMKRLRAEKVVTDLLEATIREMGPTALAEWRGDVTLDATPIVTNGKKGAPYSSKAADDLSRRGPSDWSSGIYGRTSKHEATTDSTKAKTWKVGYEATLALMVPNNPDELSAHPNLTIGLGFDPANNKGNRLLRTAARVMQSIPERGHPVGTFTGDRGYQPDSDVNLFTIPVRLLGYQMVTDYKENQLGNNGHGFAGAIQVEGALYCPAMKGKENLVDATKNLHAGSITNGQYDDLITQRQAYRMRPKQAPASNGTVVMMCPARGSGATVACPLVPKSMESDNDALKPIFKADLPKKPGTCCTNASSFSVPIEADANFLQALPFGSPEWKVRYKHARSAMEGRNGYLKQVSHPALDSSGKRRLRGFTAQYLITALIIAASNLRLIDRWREELLDHDSDEDLVTYLDSKIDQKLKRKAKAALRAEKWDNFVEKRQAQVDETESDPPPQA